MPYVELVRQICRKSGETQCNVSLIATNTLMGTPATRGYDVVLFSVSAKPQGNDAYQFVMVTEPDPNAIGGSRFVFLQQIGSAGTRWIDSLVARNNEVLLEGRENVHEHSGTLSNSTCQFLLLLTDGIISLRKPMRPTENGIVAMRQKVCDTARECLPTRSIRLSEFRETWDVALPWSGTAGTEWRSIRVTDAKIRGCSGIGFGLEKEIEVLSQIALEEGPQASSNDPSDPKITLIEPRLILKCLGPADVCISDDKIVLPGSWDEATYLRVCLTWLEALRATIESRNRRSKVTSGSDRGAP